MAVIKPLGGHELLVLLGEFGLLLVVARALGEVARRFGLPSVVGELLAGFVLGPSLLGGVAPTLYTGLFPQKPEQVHLLEVVSWLGVIMLLILTGLETDVGLIVRKAKGAAAISLGGIVVPFVSGVALGFVLPKNFLGAPDKRLVFALFIGTAMSISAIPVIAKVLMEMHVIRRDIGQITLAAGMIDDTIGWILLSVVAGLASSGKISPWTAGKSILAVVAVMAVAFTLGRKAVAAIIATLDNHVGGDMVKISALMVIALGFGSVTQALHLEAVLGAFIAGILVGQVKRFDERVRHAFAQVALGVFAPVFFASAGLRVDLAKLASPKVAAIGAAVLAIAIVGKFLGAYAGARLTRIGRWEALSLGAGMNARGAMEIIVATIGLSLGILTPEMYSIILMVAVVTSLMAPPLLRWTLAHVEPGEEEQQRLAAEDRRQGSFVANIKRVLLPVRADDDVSGVAGVVGMLVSGEDVEVTSLYLERDGEREDLGRSKEAVDVHLARTRTRVRAEEGSPSQTILAEARRGYDLLVLAGTERRTSGENSLFDRVVDDVIQGAPCPLLVVSSAANGNGNGTNGNGTNGNGTNGNGLHGTDPHGNDKAHGGGNGKGNGGGSCDSVFAGGNIVVPASGGDSDRIAAEVAFSVAAGCDATVEVVHVVSETQHMVNYGGRDAIADAVEIGKELLAKLAELGEAMGATVNTKVIVADHAEHAIVEHAQDQAALIVLASTRRPLTQRAFFGHSIDYVVGHSPCPVVVVSAP